MKNLFAFIVVFVAASMLACQDGKDESGAVVHDLSFYKNIGTQIPVETGMRWLETYKKKNNTSGRTNTSGYAVSAELLSSSLNSVTGLAGVTFHHAIDDAGERHIIIAPLDESLTVWAPIPGRIYIDANTNAPISRFKAREWAKNYEEAHPGEIQFHFFGSNIFDDISTIPFFTTLNIEPAINDLDQSPQLLLIVYNGDLVLDNSRVSSETMAIYDASSPCPPCPPVSEYQ
ncbi:hypothetical protein [Chryseosolibacter indicus]|uniref:Uncharacterized protein n=1 Tax=Chryseosolibacter indicus TaxID=2782351 RepID=A0ABS5VUG2_9BACT|nr:hypothetical protein [Chryseosolibacter indicus]MBT1705070.1 hypothetical protein [Chryseosolibacter indicus]